MRVYEEMGTIATALVRFIGWGLFRVLSPFDQRLREAEATRRAEATLSPAYVPVVVPDILKRNEKGDE